VGRRKAIAGAIFVAAVTATAPAAASAATTPVRVEIVSRSQGAVAQSNHIRTRISATKRTRVRITGRVRTTRRSLTLTRPRTLTLRKRGTRTVLLKLTRKGAKEMTRVNRACAGSTVQVTATRKRRAYRSAKRSLRRDLRRCLPGTPPGGPGSGYRVGVAAREINPAANGRFDGKAVNLGGYGIGGPPFFSGRAATGILADGIHVRAFAVTADTGGAFAIADIETQGWFAANKDGPYGLVDMRKAVERRTGGALRATEVVIQSDHSHSGPDPMGVWGGVPIGYRKLIADRAVDAITEAFATRRAGSLFYGTAPGRDLLSNQFAYDAANKPVDSDVRVLQARRPSGRPFATLLDFSAHATVLGSENTKVSGDWVQTANPQLAERFGGEPMTVVGTLGRTQPADRGCDSAPLPPRGPARDLCSIRAYSERVVERAEDAAIAAKPLGGRPTVVARSYLIRDLPTNALILGLNILGDPIGVGLNRSLSPPWLTGPSIGTVTASARIGDVLMSSIPGEAYPQIALAVAGAVPARGHMTAGLANDQLGYLIAPYRAYPEPIRRTFFNERGDELSPIDNDNYFFNVSHTMGERVTCSLLRGAGEVFDRATAYRDARAGCGPFGLDGLEEPGADTR
jgi:hypothetical protein